MIVIPQAISDSDTTIAITPDPSIPQDDGRLQIDDEQITYSTLYMGTLYGCVRGANSTTAVSHSAGTAVVIADFFQAPPVPATTFPILAPTDTSIPYSFVGNTTAGMSVDGGNLNIATDSTFLSFNFTDSGSTLGTFAYFARNAGNSFVLNSGNFQIVDDGLSVLWTDDAGSGFGHSQVGQADIYSGGSITGSFDSDATSGNTRFLLWDVDTNTLQRVSVGVADSGGTGFKLLRIPN